MSNPLQQDSQSFDVDTVLWAEIIECWKSLLEKVSSKHITFDHAIVELQAQFSDTVQDSIGLELEREVDPRIQMLWDMGRSTSTAILRSNGLYIDWVTQNPLRKDILQKETLRRQVSQAIEDVNLLRHTLRRLSWMQKIRKKSKLEAQINEHSMRVDALKGQLSKQQTKIERMMNFWTGGVIERFVDALVPITAGSFRMGSVQDDEQSYPSEHPAQPVTLPNDFLMGKFPVTQVLWQRVMGNNPSRFKGDHRPVDSVSWFDAVNFCNKLSELEELESVYAIEGSQVACNWDAKGYRLPTEAEWEYCARGNEAFIYSGSDILGEVGWYDGNSGDETHPVGLKKPNGFGLYDMSGNVYEWVWDWYGSYSSDSPTDLSGPFGQSTRTRRGGGWCSIARDTRVSFRDGVSPVGCGDFLGFRIMRSI